MKRAFFCLVVIFNAAFTFAQDARIGLPAFGSFDQTPYDTVNRQNLNTHIMIPIATIPGRGFPFQATIGYDSINWSISGTAWVPDVNNGGAPTWGWGRATSSGGLSYTYAHTTCHVNGVIEVGERLSNFQYTDVKGNVHAFGGVMTDCPLGENYSNFKGYSSDSAGYYFNSNNGDLKVTAPSGVNTDIGQLTDTNGNYVTSGGAGGLTSWTDTRNHSALIIDNSVAGTTKYEVIDQAGVNTTIYTLTSTQYYIKTSFNCAGITDYTGTTLVYLPTTISLPNGQSYTFTYERPSGYQSNQTTGRLASMTTPTGAVYQYTYSGANGGINCSDGTYTGLTRTITQTQPSNLTHTWTFTRAANGSNWNTTVTYPQMPYDSAANQDVFTFNSSKHEISHAVYQGTSTLIETVATTWDVTYNVPTQITTTLPSNGWHKDVVQLWTAYGQIQSFIEYDWTTGSGFGTQLRDIETTYQSSINPNYLNANLLNLVATQKIFGSATPNDLRSSAAYTYDEVGKVTNCPTGVAGHNDTLYGCSNGGSGSSSTNPRGLVTTLQQYTNLSTNPGTSPVTSTYTYDVFGNTLTTTVGGVLQSTASYTSSTVYSAPDSVTLGSSPSLTTSYQYNSYTGMPTQQTDPNGGVTQQSYDALLRPLVTTRPDNKTITNSYSDSARTVTTTTPFDGTTTLTTETWADQLGRVYQVQNPNGTTQTTFDPFGRTYQVSNPYANGGSASYWTATKYDALGRVLSVTTPDNVSSSNSYTTTSGTAYIVTSTDGAGKQKMGYYDGLGRLTSLYEPDVTTQGNPLTVLTSYTYTALGSLLTVSQGQQSRSFAYDGLNRITQVQTPEAGTVQFTYDTCSKDPSNVCTRTDARGVVTNYAYDGLNRPYTVSYNVGTTGVPATNTVTYTFGTSAASYNNGRLIGVNDTVHNDSYTYDLLGNVLSVSQSVDGQTYTTQYQPNDAGLTKKLTYPSGMYLSYGYDSNGNLNSITDNSGKRFASGIAYNNAGQVTGYSMGLAGGTVNAGFGYSAQRLQLGTLSYNVNGTNTIFSLSYGYTQNGGNNGQITSITDNVQSGRSGTYTFDALNRLTNYQTVGSTGYPQQTMSWSYDRYGNRLTQVLNGNVQTLSPSSTTNHLGGYAYDANGNLTNDGSNGLTWDAENRMVNYGTGTGSIGNEYDGNNLRVRRTKQGGTDVAYVFAGTQPIAEYVAGTAAINPSVEYVYLGAHLISSKASGTYTFYERDHVSIRGVIGDSSPTSPTEKGHLPFGENWYPLGDTNKWKFTSYERDTDVGDDYALMRRYQYTFGRFSSPDSLMGTPNNPQSWNRYVYVLNDPVNATDPAGLQLVYVWWDDGSPDGGGGWFDSSDLQNAGWDIQFDPNTGDVSSITPPPGGSAVMDQSGNIVGVIGPDTNIWASSYQESATVNVSSTPDAADTVSINLNGTLLPGVPGGPMAPSAQRLLRAITAAAPTFCGGGGFGFLGVQTEGKNGLLQGKQGFAGGIVEWDSNTGWNGGGLVEGGQKNVGGGGAIITSKDSEGILFIPVAESPIAEGGLVATTSAFGGYVEFGHGPIGGGVGGYVNVTTNAGCNQLRRHK